MLDLGSSINVMSHALANELNLSHIKKTNNLIQFRSLIRPLGLCENVLVKVDELKFPVDFFIIDMHENGSPNATSIILGRPFLKTAKVKMNIGKEIISVEYA
ncbi:MAG: retropepsin-like aspartic protease [Sweet potato little leaf phytoplasma]|nr:retropepsin-like aspartic protease [Sweet potato little leaf phytoplasma]